MHVVYLLVHKLRQIWDGRLEFKEMIEKREIIKAKKKTFLESVQQINAGRWPNGIKPFNPGYECPELDQAFPEAIGKEYIFHTKYPPNCTIREVKQKAYLS